MTTLKNFPHQIDDTVPIPGSKRTLFAFNALDHSSVPLEDEQYPVIIVGSSMVGMTLGVLLGYHGIKSVSFDRHPSTAIHPRAALFLLRSVEIFRQLGLMEVMRNESALNFDLDAGMIIVEQLVGGKTIMSLQESDPVEVAKVSPCVRLWLTQNMFEPLLRREAKNFGAKQEFSEAVVWYEAVDDGVIVVVQNLKTMGYRKFKAQYLVACDGNRSATREKEGIEWHGPGILGDCISINFKADLAPYLGTRAVHGVTYITNPRIDAGFRLESGGQGGFMIVARAGARNGFLPDSVTEREARQYFYDASGIDHEIELEIESISYWNAAALVADRFDSEDGRVFIAGDAAHLLPPTGGMGGNTGVQDVHNLAWKLAFALSGKASPSLLQSYSTERRPTAKFAMQQAYKRFQKRVLQQKLEEDELPDIVCEIGYRYLSGAFVANSEAVTAEKVWEDPYEPLVAPGCRLPHVDIVDERRPEGMLSTLDLIGTKFVLIVVEKDSPWIIAAEECPELVDAYALSHDSSPFNDSTGRVKDIFKLGRGEAILVRPDGFVAWRAGEKEEGHAKFLTSTLQGILHGDGGQQDL